MSRLFKTLLGGLVFLVIVAVLFEAALRVIFDRYDPGNSLVFEAQSNGFRLGRPGFDGRHFKNTGDFDVHVHINSSGFRDRKDVAEAGANDWFLVGDSFGFGFGVEEQDRFSNLLEKRLGIDVYNISVPNDLDGYKDLIEYARARGAQIERLMVAICMENDIKRYGPTVRRGEGLSPSLTGLKSFLSKSSASYKMLTEIAHQSPLLRAASVSLGLINENLEGIPGQRYSSDVIRGSIARVERLLQLPGLRDALVVVIPSRGLWVEDHRMEHVKTHDAFVRGLADKGVVVIDLRSEFERRPEPLSYHFLNDGHWNEAGHAMAAAVIGDSIEILFP